MLLTVNGQAKVIVQDAAAYRRMLELLDRMEMLEGLQESLVSMKQGKGKPAREFFEELRKKHGIPLREK